MRPHFRAICDILLLAPRRQESILHSPWWSSSGIHFDKSGDFMRGQRTSRSHSIPVVICMYITSLPMASFLHLIRETLFDIFMMFTVLIPTYRVPGTTCRNYYNANIIVHGTTNLQKGVKIFLDRQQEKILSLKLERCCRMPNPEPRTLLLVLYSVLLVHRERNMLSIWKPEINDASRLTYKHFSFSLLLFCTAAIPVASSSIQKSKQYHEQNRTYL